MSIPSPQLGSFTKRAHAFVDGGYLRAKLGLPNVDHKLDLKKFLFEQCGNMVWGHSNDTFHFPFIFTSIFRINYYDASTEESSDQQMEKYWNELERISDVKMRFGELRGKPRRQKGVDVLLAVDIVVGAFERLFDVAILVAGDADFVPVLTEVQRHGVMTLLIGEAGTTSPELIKASDRYLTLHKPW